MTYLIVFIVAVAALLWFFKWDRKNSIRMKNEQELLEKEEMGRKEREHAEIIAKANRLAGMAELARQAQVVSDEKTYEAVMDGTYDGNVPERRSDGLWMSVYDDLRILKIAGIKYRGNLSAYVGQFKGVLVPEPKNEYDPFAIMVKVEDGRHIGYIKEEQTELVRWMVGHEQSLGEEKPTVFPPYRIVGWIEVCGDEYEGAVYVRKNG